MREINMSSKAIRYMHSTGIECFINNFEVFHKNIINNSKENIIHEMNNKYSKGGILIRIKCAEKIIRDKCMLNEVLNYIIYKSKKINNDIKHKAKIIKEQYCINSY